MDGWDASRGGYGAGNDGLRAPLPERTHRAGDHGRYPSIRGDTDGVFRLTLETDQDRYRAGQPIEVVATLTYLGPGETVVARGSSNPGLVGFRVESSDPALMINPAFTTDCAPHQMSRGVPVVYPMAKSGGFSESEPLAPFYRAYFDDPELRLPAGTWTMRAGAGFYSGADCGDIHHGLSTSVTVVVEP